MPTRIILARHGETDWNLQYRYQGHSDTPLNETGRAQARALSEQLAGKPIAAVYSSDLVRAHETARIVAGTLGLDVTVLPSLRERNFGAWEGLRHEEIVDRFPGSTDSPDAESRDDLSRRVLESLAAIAAAHRGQTVLVVSHGGAIRAALRHHAHPDSDGPTPNCCVFDLEVD